VPTIRRKADTDPIGFVHPDADVRRPSGVPAHQFCNASGSASRLLGRGPASRSGRVSRAVALGTVPSAVVYNWESSHRASTLDGESLPARPGITSFQPCDEPRTAIVMGLWLIMRS
jgi:hypothetical protein